MSEDAQPLLVRPWCGLDPLESFASHSVPSSPGATGNATDINSFEGAFLRINGTEIGVIAFASQSSKNPWVSFTRPHCGGRYTTRAHHIVTATCAYSRAHGSLSSTGGI